MLNLAFRERDALEINASSSVDGPGIPFIPEFPRGIQVTSFKRVLKDRQIKLLPVAPEEATTLRPKKEVGKRLGQGHTILCHKGLRPSLLVLLHPPYHRINIAVIEDTLVSVGREVDTAIEALGGASCAVGIEFYGAKGENHRIHFGRRRF